MSSPAKDFDSMDSKQLAPSTQSSGSSSVDTFSSNFNSETKDVLVAVTGSEEISNASVNGKSNSVGVSDDGGYVSGEEVFEMAPESPLEADPEIVEKGIEGEAATDPSAGSSDISMPKAEMSTSDVSAVDDVEKCQLDGGLEGGSVEGGGVVLGKGSSSVLGDLGRNLIAVNGAVEGSKGNKVTENTDIDDVLGSKVDGTLMPEVNEVATIVPKGEDAMEDKKVESLNDENYAASLLVKDIADVSEDSTSPSRNTYAFSQDTVKSADSKLVETDAAQFSDNVDSVVGTRGPEVTVVEKYHTKNTNIEEMADATVGSMASADVSDATSHSVGGSPTCEPLKGHEHCEIEIMKEADSRAKQNDSKMNIPADKIEDVVDADGDENKLLDLLNQPSVEALIIEAKWIDCDDVQVSSNGDVLASRVSGKSDSIESNESDVVLNQEVVSEAEDKTENRTDEVHTVDLVNQSSIADVSIEAKQRDNGLENIHGKSDSPDSVGPNPILNPLEILEAEEVAENQSDEEGGIQETVSDGEADDMIFGSSEAAKQFIKELEQRSGGGSQSGAENYHDPSQVDGQIVTDSEEEVDTDEEGDGKELFDSAALAAFLKAATGAESDGGNITITSQDGSRLFSVERPAGLGSSLRSLKPAPRANRPSLFTPSSITSAGELNSNLSEEEKKKLEKLQLIRVKFLRLIQRLGFSPDETVAAQVLYRLALVAGRQTGNLFNLEAAKRTALLLETEGKEPLSFSLNILVLGKSGVGKSATINSIFGEDRTFIDAFEPATSSVKEISGIVDGVEIRVFDTPGLKSSAMEQAFNRSVLSSIKKFTKKSPPDIVLYVDRMDAQTRDLNDLPLLRTVTSSLGTSIWRSTIVTLTHAASAPPDGPSGSPLSYETFISQRSHVVQQSIGQAVGDLRLMSPSLMNPVALVENHSSCRKNREGQKVLPNGQSWRPQLLLLCYSMKILSEASSLSKPQDPFDHRKLFGFRVRAPPLPYILSSMLQSRAHPKLPSELGGDNGDSDIDLEELSDSDQEDEEDEYDQLPPFKPLKKSQLAKLSREQKKAYFEEYDYRVKLLQKKQWKEELKRMREMKKKGKDTATDFSYMDEDAETGAAAPVAVPLPDMVLPPSFDGDTPAYRYRFLEPTSQFLARPVLDTHGWDHDCGYDGVNIEQSLAIGSQFPAAVTIQVTKDKKDFSINLDSSVSAKHGENGSSMAGFDIQSIGKQLAYIVRGEAKFKNLKKNKTAAGVSVTFLGENVVPGLKIEDQIVLGKQYVLVGSAGTVRFQQDAAYGANFELQRRELDYPIGQVQSTFGLSIIKWRGDLALGFNSLAQFSVGRGSKVAVRAGINNKLSGQINVRTSSSEHLSLALAGIIPTALAIYRRICPGVSEKYSIY